MKKDEKMHLEFKRHKIIKGRVSRLINEAKERGVKVDEDRVELIR